MTIVVPVRNRENMVLQTLDSIFAQTYRPIELIIVDNGSTDRTPALIERWAANHTCDGFTVKVLHEAKEGAAAARNRGLQETTSPFVMFFDSDDIMEFDHVQRIMEHIGSHTDVELVHWGISLRDADGWTTQKHSRAESSELMREHILHGTLATHRFCVRTDTLRSIGGWNESLSTWDDLELGVRLLRIIETEKIHRLNGSPRIIVQIHDQSLTGPSFSSRADAQEAALDSIEQLVAYDPRLSLILAARRIILAAQYRKEGSRKLALRQREKAVENCGRSDRFRLKAIYACQLTFGRGASELAMRLFKESAKP